jgi:hypothetical protein
MPRAANRVIELSNDLPFTRAPGLQPGGCRFDVCYNSEGCKLSDLSRGEPLEVRDYLDPHIGQTHVCGHGVSESEVEEVRRGRGEDLGATGNSRRTIGQTLAGRFLQVFSAPDEAPDSVFVITAYEPQAKAKKAFRRRQRRKLK